MLSINGAFRTVDFINYKEEQKTDRITQQPYTKKTALVLVATNRPYMSTVVANGQAVTEPDGKGGVRVKKEYASDFFLAKFTGHDAQTANTYLSQKNGDKIVSRQLYINGHMETYDKKRVVPIEKQVNIGGQVYNVKFDQEITTSNTIIVVSHFEFLDKKKDTTAVAVTPTTAMPAAVAQVAQVAQPVAAPAPVQYAQPGQVAQPAQVAQPVQPVQYVQAAQPVQPTAVVQNGAVVTPTGKAPF